MKSPLFSKGACALLVITASLCSAPALQAEIDGHGPDAWRVAGVASNDRLNARMGPGTQYRVIESFAHNERGLQQITCVPFYTFAHFAAMSVAQINALPARWCLMRDSALRKAGWVAQKYITPDDGNASGNGSGAANISPDDMPVPFSGQDPPIYEDLSHGEPYLPDPAIDPVDQARELIMEIYERQFQADNSSLPSAFDPQVSRHYFSNEIVAWLASGQLGAHPLYGAQDFDGSINEPEADPHQPMLRGMITINVDFTNFGKPQRAVFYLRGDTDKPGAPLRVFRVEHEGWSYP